MLTKLKNSKRLGLSESKGFTIIEVMIVLAIAGLIILVVLLAVPALQRNARNTAIKNDASAIAGAVTEFESNNDGKLPTTVSQTGSSVDVKTASATDTTATAKVQGSTTVAVGAGWPAAAGTINVSFGNKCNGSTAVTASARSTAILYLVETSNSTAKQCLDS